MPREIIAGKRYICSLMLAHSYFETELFRHVNRIHIEPDASAETSGSVDRTTFHIRRPSKDHLVPGYYWMIWMLVANLRAAQGDLQPSTICSEIVDGRDINMVHSN